MKKEITSYNFIDRFENFISLGGGHVPAFLYCGNPPVLFDPGVSAFGPLYLKKITEHISRPEEMILALTHSHFDHCGAAPYLRRKIPGLRIAASSRAASILQRPNAVKLIRRLNAEYEKEMPKDLEEEDVGFEPLDIDIKLQNNGRLELNNGKYCEILETPGHTRDCLSYFFPDSGVLLAGEAAGVVETGFIHSPFLTIYEDYMNSLEKLRALKPVALCIAHNGILAGKELKHFITESLAAAKAYKEMIENYLIQYKGDQEKVVQRIVAEEYDSQPDHIQNREPFILNLEAKINAVVKLMD
jgi:glyoxylase-like metal-dependent hydrolase (beta-lactamase superfamily II)